MATSGSTDFSDSLSDIARDAYIAIGAADAEEVLEGPQFEYAKRQLNRMIKALQARGYNLWRDEELTFSLTADKQSYTMGNSGDVSTRPLRIIGARYRDSNSKDLPMTELGRSDYFDLPEKDVNGTPTNFYYDPGRVQGTFYVWPVPDSNTADTIQLTYQRTVEDFDENADEPDFPQEWYHALVHSLAAELAPSVFPNNPAIAQTWRQKAAESLAVAESFDRETASLFLKRDYG